MSTASDQNLRDANVPAFGAMQSSPALAANEDHLPHAPTPASGLNSPGLNSLGADMTATGWDAYDVWRRLIKDARDRRQS
ncbi:MAG TPA: hypothetical protein VK629_16095 [Steroidobacteraceae bacterium]|nr:hypothetical protein [Steroidobacteraceae bacterium]